MFINSIKKAAKLRGKTVLWRADLNVPLDAKRRIKDEYKIVKQLPTLRFLLRYGCKVLVVSHLGRPSEGKVDEKYSLKPVALRLEKILNLNVDLIPDIGLELDTALSGAGRNRIVMLENIRFFKGEKKNSRTLAKKLASRADFFVNDAFAVSHRKHASVAAVQDYLPSYAGLLMKKELEHLARVITPKKPLIVVIGGAKMETKIPLVKTLGKKAEKILLGGALANNFFAAQGLEVGTSMVDRDSINFVRKLKKDNIVVPVDVIVGAARRGGQPGIRKTHEVGHDESILDIGPETIRLYSSYIRSANTIIWNGPLGLFEEKRFSHGTLSIAHMVASRSKSRAFAVAGGGETVEALKKTKQLDWVDWVSTGGGAMLSYLGSEKMPGLAKIIK